MQTLTTRTAAGRTAKVQTPHTNDEALKALTEAVEKAGGIDHVADFPGSLMAQHKEGRGFSTSQWFWVHYFAVNGLPPAPKGAKGAKEREQKSKKAEKAEMAGGILKKKFECSGCGETFTREGFFRKHEAQCEGAEGAEEKDHITRAAAAILSSIGPVFEEKMDEQMEKFDPKALEGIITAAVADEAAKRMKPIGIEIKAQGKKPKKMKGVFPEEFPRLLELAQSRMNILMVGPTGCGKSHLASEIAKALDLRFASVSCTAGMSENFFLGYRLPISGSKFEYVPTDFVNLYESGGVFCVDEMDNADENLLGVLNQALANDRFYIPHRFEKPEVIRHPDFVCIATANTYGHGSDLTYCGRNQLDAATLDRFRTGIVTLDYNDDVEKMLASSAVLNWGRKMRLALKKSNSPRVISTRLLKEMTKMEHDHGWGQADWERAYFADFSADESHTVRTALDRL